MGIFSDLFGKHGHKKDKTIQELLEIIKQMEGNEKRLLRMLEECEKPHSENVKLVLYSSSNKNQITMALQLDQGSFSLDTIGLQDLDLGTPVSATFANTTFTSSDPTIFTTTADPTNPNQTNDTAVAPGTASLLIQTDATYVDSKKSISVTKTLTLTVPVLIAAVVAGENVGLVFIQGAPTILPTPPTT
jgi:hypothetical protein